VTVVVTAELASAVPAFPHALNARLVTMAAIMIATTFLFFNFIGICSFRELLGVVFHE
jgi:hypothetical protein